ncbi:exosome complex exonuclease Rrp41 [Candidatus Woesearchaeota archaeon]|nr:exosome complex exonuclease Rrp41 [Candidatus Woesearchaeota archaeon]
MSYDKRYDGRKPEELRPMSAKVGVIPNADGSAMFQVGNTVCYAAVYGPRELHPKFLQDPKKGILRVNYNMMPFSGHGDRVRPGRSRRSQEIALVIQNALLPVLDLSDYPKAVVDVFIELPQTDAGTRCAGIVAASMALAHAGLKMKELVSAVAVGKVGDSVVADLTYDEEAFEGEGGSTDMPMAILANSGTVSLLQMDGEINKEHLATSLDLAKKAAQQISDLQKKTLKEYYQ